MKYKLNKIAYRFKQACFAHQGFSPDDFPPPNFKHHHGRHRKEKNLQSGTEALTSGLIFTFAFGLAWYLTGWWFWIFPFIFAGILPVVEGIRKILRERRESKLTQQDTVQETDALAEKEILRVARAEQGRVTPTIVALNTSLSVEKAEQLLEAMVKRGYAGMHVTESGRIEYEFPEFLPPPEDKGSITE